MSERRKNVIKVLLIILAIVLMIAGIGVIISAVPITHCIATLAIENHLIYALLWTILLLFVWAIGACMFLCGIIVPRMCEEL